MAGTCQRRKGANRLVHAFVLLTIFCMLCLVDLLQRHSLRSREPLAVASVSYRSKPFIPTEWSSKQETVKRVKPLDDDIAGGRISCKSCVPSGYKKVLNLEKTALRNPLLDIGQRIAQDGPYHNYALFERDYEEMVKNFKIFVYPDAYQQEGEFSEVFLPHSHPLDWGLGNYFSEHKFKITILASQFITKDPSKAHLFFLPFSVNVLRGDIRVKQEENIVKFVAEYINKVSQEFEFWNRTEGADHFFVCCHSVGRDVPQALPALKRNAIQLVCSSNYFYKTYVPHKDVALPQVWPRKPTTVLNTPEKRNRLAFYAGRIQNSKVRQRLLETWGGDPDLDFYSGSVNGSYEKHFQDTKFCVHVKGYEVNTARISDAIFFGCVPVIISDYYDLPLGDILDWRRFSVIISHTRIPDLKSILQGVTQKEYRTLHNNLLEVRKHFQWNDVPKKYDAFHVSMYQLWLRRFVVRDPYFLQGSNTRRQTEPFTSSFGQ